MSQIRWQDHTVHVKRSQRKTVALYVKQGKIEARVPMHCTDREVSGFVAQKASWLTRTLNKQAQNLASVIDYSQASQVPLMDAQLPLHIEMGSRLGWRRTDIGLTLWVQEQTREQVHFVLSDFYAEAAKPILHKKTVDLAERLGWLDRLTGIRFRRTKTKWGHCTSQGRIQYNGLIVQAPERVVDYLVAHEVSHLQHLNHSPAFWQQVGEIHTSYQEDRLWLKQQGLQLQLE